MDNNLIKRERRKAVVQTILAMLLLVFLTAVAFISYQAYVKRDVLGFAYSHPNLVSALKSQYASESAQLERKLTDHTPSPDDQLKMAVVESLKK